MEELYSIFRKTVGKVLEDPQNQSYLTFLSLGNYKPKISPQHMKMVPRDRKRRNCSLSNKQMSSIAKQILDNSKR